MTRIVTLVGAAAMALSPAAFAQTAPGQGQNNGTGYWHFNGPAEAPGPDVECGEEDALGSPIRSLQERIPQVLGHIGEPEGRLLQVEIASQD